MKKVFFLMVFFVMCFVSFGQDTPKSIEEALEYLDKTWTEEFKTEFKNKEERKATLELHMNIGAGIRNSWLRHGNGKDKLYNELLGAGVTDMDDMSDIILTSFHRKLNNKFIDVEGQAKRKKEYYINFMREQDEIQKNKSVQFALETFNQFKVNDIIDIYYPLSDYGKGLEIAFTNVYYFEWKFESDEDLKITGIILDKYYESDNPFFKVKIKEINRGSILLHSKEIKKGEIFEFDLREVKTTEEY